MVTDLIRRPCTLVKRPVASKSRYGNPTRDSIDVQTVCELQQRTRDEIGEQSEVSTSDWMAFFLPTEVVGREDRLIVDGETYEMVGGPWPVTHPPTGRVSHIEASVRLIKGTQ